jgi:hypothetical protein
MKTNAALKQALAAAGLIVAAGCATQERAFHDTLNERSDRLAHLEDRRPPNPNMPRDNRELKAIPTVVQHDPAFNQPQTDVGTPGASVETGRAASRPALLSDRVRAAIFPNDPASSGSSPNGRVEVTSHAGLVTLSGVVESDAERSRLEEEALKVQGVTSVDNQIIVTQTPRE